MTTWNCYVVGDGSHPASFAAAKGVAANIPTNADLIAYVGDIYPQGHRYYIEVEPSHSRTRASTSSTASGPARP